MAPPGDILTDILFSYTNPSLSFDCANVIKLALYTLIGQCSLRRDLSEPCASALTLKSK